MLAPIDSRTSALPVEPDIALLPCFATVIPIDETSNAVAVDMFNVLAPSPPVPHVSRTGVFICTETDFCLIMLAIPAISSAVSPLKRRAVIKEAI